MKLKNASHTKPRQLFFPDLSALEARHIAVRDSRFWLHSTNTAPLSGNPPENSQSDNANFVLLPSIIPLK